MITHTWIEVGGGLMIGIIALTGFFKMRPRLKAMPRQTTRELRTRMLIVYASHVVIWTIVGLFNFSGVLSFFYFTAIGAIYIPIIIWVLKSPIDDHVA